MKTKPWTKQTAREAMLERTLKSLRGIMGYFASFHSLRKKRIMVRTPNIRRERTVAEVQGKETPPYSRPRRNIIVPPVIVITPIQSMAFRPAMIGVLGVSTSRKTRIMTKARASNGTEGFISWRGLRRTGKAGGHTVDVKTPSPRDLLCEDASKNRSNSTR